MIKTFAFNSITGFIAGIPTAASIFALNPEAENSATLLTAKTVGILGAACIGGKLSHTVSKYLKSDPTSAVGGISAGVLTAVFPEQLAKLTLIALAAIGSVGYFLN